jgi:tetratricopeptide (TPR) repeat protein
MAEAEAEIREAIRLDAEYWPAYQYLGNLLYEQDRKEEAREALDRVPLDVTWHRLALERLVSMCPEERPKRRTLEAMLRRSPRRTGKRGVAEMMAQLEKRFDQKAAPPKEGPPD